MVNIVEMVVCTSRVLRMKEHLPFFREFNIPCVENRVNVDRVKVVFL